MSTRFQPAVATLVAFTLACGDSVGPGDAPGTYVLRRIDGDPLPAILYDNEIYAVRVISDTIRLHANGTGLIAGVRDFLPLHEGLPPQPPVHQRTRIRYAASGDALEINFECPPDADCVPGPHLIAHIGLDGLTARWGPSMIGRSPLFYTQVAVTR